MAEEEGGDNSQTSRRSSATIAVSEAIMQMSATQTRGVLRLTRKERCDSHGDDKRGGILRISVAKNKRSSLVAARGAATLRTLM